MNRIGKDTRGWLQSPSSAPDDLGQPAADSWTNVALISAKVSFLSGMETLKAEAMTSLVKANVRIRTRSDVRSGWRYLVGDTAYDIVSVPPSGSRHDYMDLGCEVRT
jgi:SPP1 family predicted phage head-tail adaptor